MQATGSTTPKINMNQYCQCAEYFTEKGFEFAIITDWNGSETKIKTKQELDIIIDLLYNKEKPL